MFYIIVILGIGFNFLSFFFLTFFWRGLFHVTLTTPLTSLPTHPHTHTPFCHRLLSHMIFIWFGNPLWLAPCWCTVSFTKYKCILSPWSRSISSPRTQMCISTSSTWSPTPTPHCLGLLHPLTSCKQKIIPFFCARQIDSDGDVGVRHFGHRSVITVLFAKREEWNKSCTFQLFSNYCLMSYPLLSIYNIIKMISYI